jgi:hypothetical protein
MYSGITKIYYRKPVNRVFKKPVPTERTTQFFPPVSCFSSSFTFLPLGDARICSEKMAAPGEKSFCVLEYHTSKSVVTVQRAFRAKSKTGYSSHHCHVRSWLRHCATSQKVAGSIPDGFIGFFH